jgi:hypothetical protein
VSAYDALNRLTKWRGHFAGWQLGTRLRDDPESQAVRDHREVSMLLRVEVNALIDLLTKKGIVSAAELDAAIEREANTLGTAYEKRWPGVRATDDGLAYDFARINKAGWMKGWRP